MIKLRVIVREMDDGNVRVNFYLVDTDDPRRIERSARLYTTRRQWDLHYAARFAADSTTEIVSYLHDAPAQEKKNDGERERHIA